MAQHGLHTTLFSKTCRMAPHGLHSALFSKTCRMAPHGLHSTPSTRHNQLFYPVCLTALQCLEWHTLSLKCEKSVYIHTIVFWFCQRKSRGGDKTVDSRYLSFFKCADQYIVIGDDWFRGGGVLPEIFGSRVQHSKNNWTQSDLSVVKMRGQTGLKSMKKGSIGLKIKEKIDNKCLKSVK